MSNKIPKRPKPVKSGNLRPTRKKMARIICLLRLKKSTLSQEILTDASNWKNNISKSHWPLMTNLDSDHPEVLAEIKKIKIKGGEIIRRYNVNYGMEEEV